MSFKIDKKIVAAAFVAILIGFALGLFYSFYMLVRIAPSVGAAVGIIRIAGYIETPEVVSMYADAISQAAFNESVKAVVLQVDSGGGYADYVEQIYLDLLELKGKKPVIASLTTALSGGYYIAAAADYIYAHPTSMIGNIGVIGSGPLTLIPSEQGLETGAFKVTGFSKLLFPYTLRQALDNFVSAVENGRGNKLKLTGEELRRGQIYLGTEALNLGLVDELGSVQRAINEAAKRAELAEYTVFELTRLEGTFEETVQPSNANASVQLKNVTLEMLDSLHPPPALHYVYIPQQIATKSIVSKASTATSDAGAHVIVDVSHGNMVSWWDLDALLGELVNRNITASFVSLWSELESKLDNAGCLIIASPTQAYTMDECEKVEKFVEKGGVLLLFYDPSWEFIGEQGVLQGIIGPINSMSQRFGLTFAKGYLYNEAENFGIYRNIYLKNFGNNALTEKLKTVVFFTATHINCVGKGVAWTSNDTYSSIAERKSNYTVIACAKWGNGTIAGFGDITFLTEPWCYVEDNHQLLSNLASLIEESKVETLPEEETGEIKRPELPVGTEKIYNLWVDSKEGIVKWFKISETETFAEWPDATFHYHYNEKGSLIGIDFDGISLTYEVPIPEAPYPLTLGKKWSHETSYSLKIQGEEVEGYFVIEEEVTGFEYVRSEEGNEYFCAKVEYTSTDSLMVNQTKITIASTGYYWTSHEVGDVKDESVTTTYQNGMPYRIEIRKLLLKSFYKGV